MSQPDFTVEHLDPRTLTANPLNWRRHPENQKAAIQASLKEFGWVDGPLLNRTTGNLIDGHLRVEEAIAQGRETVPVKVVELSPSDEKRLLRLFDPITALATEDEETLERLIAEIGDPDLERLLGELETGSGGLLEDADPDAIPENATTRCKPGDLWRLGEHRLLCGDSTVSTDVERLMGDEIPQMVFADPPYGISIVSGGKVGGAAPFGKKGTVDTSRIIPVNQYASVIGDDSPRTATEAYSIAASLWPEAVHVWWGGNHYADQLPASPCWIVWDKERTGDFADAELAWTNRPSAVRIFRHMWNGLIKASERTEKRVHPTQKPVALAEWVFETYGQARDLVMDPFLGSGMSIIAGEKTRRRVYGCELSPEYGDVILARWEQATGRTAELA